jgi:hypothetical protein
LAAPAAATRYPSRMRSRSATTAPRSTETGISSAT